MQIVSDGMRVLAACARPVRRRALPDATGLSEEVLDRTLAELAAVDLLVAEGGRLFALPVPHDAPPVAPPANLTQRLEGGFVMAPHR